MKRQAILFSAGEYEKSVELSINNLPGVKYDIYALGKRLTQIGFNVIKKENVKRAEYFSALKYFAEKSAKDAIHIVYFTGHGGHCNGKNYIFPADLGPSFDQYHNFDDAGINIEEIIRIFKGKGRLILILDACRRDDIGLSKGYYSEMTSSEDVYIAYGTMFKEYARGRKDGLSWFTEAICDEILTPNIDVDTLFTRVRQNIFIKHFTQIPPSVNALLDNVVLHAEYNYGNIDENVHDFVKKHADEYEDKYGYFQADDMIFIDAAQYFNVSLLDAIWMYQKVENKIYIDKGVSVPNLPEAEQKIISFLNLSQKKYFTFDECHTWYYRGKQIRMGEIPPLPPSMQRKLPEEGKEILIEGWLICNETANGVSFTLNSNIPDETPLIFSLRGKHYFTQSSCAVSNRQATSATFSNKGDSLADGIYELTITAPCYNVLPESTKNIFGESNRNLIGQNISYSPVFGNTIKFTFHCLVYGVGVEVIKE